LYFNTARDVLTVLLIFAKHLSPYLRIFTGTYRDKHTHAHMYNQHTRGMVTTRHRSLVARGGRKAFVLDTDQKKKGKNRKKMSKKKLKFTNLK